MRKADEKMIARPVRRRAVRTAFAESKSGSFFSVVSRVLRGIGKLGRGIVTGAADDDPSGIATYSQVGAQFGFAMLWTMLFSYPLMAGIQEISAWIGRVTGIGIAGNIRRHYSVWVLYAVVALLLAANVINLGADISAMGSALKLLVGGSALFLLRRVLPSFRDSRRIRSISAVCADSQMVGAGAARLRRDGVCSARALAIGVGRGVYSNHFTISGLHDLVDCSVRNHDQSVSILLAGLAGSARTGSRGGRKGPQAGSGAGFRTARIDADRHLYRNGIFQRNRLLYHSRHGCGSPCAWPDRYSDCRASRRGAAPTRGRVDFLALQLRDYRHGTTGRAGSGRLGGVCSAEALKWPIGLERRPDKAKGFYGTLGAATLLGVALNFTSIDPIKALFWSAVINGVAAVPIMFVMMLMTANSKVTGTLRLPLRQKVLGWASTAVMFLVAAGMIVTWGR